MLLSISDYLEILKNGEFLEGFVRGSVRFSPCRTPRQILFFIQEGFMKINKLITIEISDENQFLGSICKEIELSMPEEELMQVFLSDKGEKIFLMNINRIAHLLDQTPDDLFKNMKSETIEKIIKWFETWLIKIKELKCQY